MEKFTPSDLVKVGLGAILIAKDKTQEMIDEAIKQGQMSKEEAEKALDELKKEATQQSKEMDKKVKNEIHAQLKTLGLATKEDITALKREIRELKETLGSK